MDLNNEEPKETAKKSGILFLVVGACFMVAFYMLIKYLIRIGEIK